MTMIAEDVTDCGEEGCGECDVCSYLDFLDWTKQVATRDFPSTIERDGRIEAYLDRTYPCWRT